ncbi:MAG: 30S ribosomal protein S4 [Candidatus Paceibacterales bacterium]
MTDTRCKICRRLGVKLFLKGERCLLPKCAMIKRPYPPGQKRKRGRRGSLSEYGKELKEKQKLKNWYNLGERQFKNCVKKVLEKRGKVEDAPALLIKALESRLDNVVFRLGFASSRAQARQLVSHGFFLVNGKPINFPSHQLKKGDVIYLKPQKIKKGIFKNLKSSIKKHKTPSWLELNVEKLEGKIIEAPSLEEVAPPVDIPTIFEFYSR